MISTRTLSTTLSLHVVFPLEVYSTFFEVKNYEIITIITILLLFKYSKPCYDLVSNKGY